MNSTNINKTNNHWTQKKTMIYDIGIPCPVPGLGQAFYIILILIWTVSVVQLIYSTKNYGWRNIIDFYDPFIKYLDNLNKIELMLLSQRLVQVIFCFVKKFGHWGTWNSPLQYYRRLVILEPLVESFKKCKKNGDIYFIVLTVLM